nr:hypothetical protein [Epilithonimonas sp.]
MATENSDTDIKGVFIYRKICSMV